MIHEMKLNENEFDNIIYKNKVMEVRLYDEKRRKIKIGDKIIFFKQPFLEEKIFVEVKALYKFRTFREAYSNFPIKLFGYDEKDVSYMLNLIYSIYTKEEENKYEVLVIKFCHI